MPPTRLTIVQEPLSGRRFFGLGVQADAYIYDDVNRRMGVGAEDLALFEARLAALRPSLVRVFVPIDCFNPSFDAATYLWDRPEFRTLVRHLHNVRQAGAKANVCMGPWTNHQMTREGMEAAAVELVDHLVRQEELHNVAWLCLFNEPDGIYAHDSDLWRSFFGDEALRKRPPWSEYVRKNLRAQELLEHRGLYPAVRLIVPDTVWGHPMRLERMRMAAADFASLDAGYSYHNYEPEYAEYYADKPNYAYPGMAAEARMLREIVGPGKEMIVWEFNNAGPGFGGFYPGTGPHGQDMIGSLEAAVKITEKVLAALGSGADGMCLWCLCDSYYNSGLKTGPMRFGLWRYKWEDFQPRPYYYYYAALCRALRPGAQLHLVEPADPNLPALAARQGDNWHIPILNKAAAAARLQLQLPAAGAAAKLRVYPQRLPTNDRMPLDDWEPVSVNNRLVDLDLGPGELTIIRTGPA